MHKFLLYIFLLFSAISFAQATKIKIKKEKEKKEAATTAKPYHNNSLDLYYGYRVYDKSYYNQINSIEKKLDPKLPIQIIGFGLSGHGYTINRSGRIAGQLNYYKIIPTRIMIQDSLKTKLSGFVYGMSLGLGLTNGKKTIGIGCYLGFNTGRSTLSKNEYISQKNQFFSPKITLQPKVIIKHISISIILEAEYDVTNPAWKKTLFNRKDLHLLQPFQQNCFTGLVSIGYKFY